MRARETRVNQGGLMRCCLGTLGDYVESDPDREVQDGDTLACAYEPPDRAPQMILDHGVWRWNRSDQAG